MICLLLIKTPGLISEGELTKLNSFTYKGLRPQILSFPNPPGTSLSTWTSQLSTLANQLTQKSHQRAFQGEQITSQQLSCTLRNK